MSIKCKTIGSVLYCYDKEKKVVIMYPPQEKRLSKCPESVIQAIINDDYDAEIIIKEQEKE